MEWGAGGGRAGRVGGWPPPGRTNPLGTVALLFFLSFLCVFSGRAGAGAGPVWSRHTDGRATVHTVVLLALPGSRRVPGLGLAQAAVSERGPFVVSAGRTTFHSHASSLCSCQILRQSRAFTTGVVTLHVPFALGMAWKKDGAVSMYRVWTTIQGATGFQGGAGGTPLACHLSPHVPQAQPRAPPPVLFVALPPPLHCVPGGGCIRPATAPAAPSAVRPRAAASPPRQPLVHDAVAAPASERSERFPSLSYPSGAGAGSWLAAAALARCPLPEGARWVGWRAALPAPPTSDARWWGSGVARPCSSVSRAGSRPQSACGGRVARWGGVSVVPGRWRRGVGAGVRVDGSVGWRPAGLYPPPPCASH